MLIIDMPMPRNCDECEVNYDCAFCGITGSAFYGNTQVPDFMPDERKLPDCPIKGEISEIELMNLEQEREFAVKNIVSERDGERKGGRGVMDKLCEFEIPNRDDRSYMCAILATAGYAVRVEERIDYTRSYPYKYYVVAVYRKDGADDER